MCQLQAILVQRTLQIDGHEVEGNAGGVQEAGVDHRDLGVALAEVREDGPVGAGLLARLHRLMRHGVPLGEGLLLEFILP